MIWPKQSAPFGEWISPSFWLGPTHSPTIHSSWPDCACRLSANLEDQLAAFLAASASSDFASDSCTCQLIWRSWLPHCGSLTFSPEKWSTWQKPMRWNKYHIIIYSLTWIAFGPTFGANPKHHSDVQHRLMFSASTHVATSSHVLGASTLCAAACGRWWLRTQGGQSTQQCLLEHGPFSLMIYSTLH